VRIALTYERRVLKRAVGTDTMAERRKKRKYNKKDKGKATVAKSRTGTGAEPEDPRDDSDPPPPQPPVDEQEPPPPPPRIDLRTAPNGLYDLKDLLPDALFANDDNDNGDTWEAFDPGSTTLYQGHHGTRMSRKQWRFDTGANRAVQRANERKRAIQPILRQLATASLKSADPERLATNLRSVWIPNWTALWAHLGARYWGIHRFGAYKRHQRVLDRVANTVLGPNHDRIAVFGNAVFAPSAPGHPPVPVTKIRNFLARKGRVVLVDEFLTSKTCHRCLGLTAQSATSFTSKHCQSVCHSTWNRDVNAARNIGRLFRVHMAGQQRPRQFCRGAANNR